MHSVDNADASVSELGRNALIIAAKVEASLAYDLITNPALLEQVKKEHVELQSKK